MATTARKITPKRIKDLRTALALTQQQLADRIGCHQVTVAGWEKGKKTPRGANLKLLLEMELQAKLKK